SSSSSSSSSSWQQGECRIDRIETREPTYRFEAEGGVTEFWDHNEQEFRCAGVSFHRHTLRRNSLLLPYYTTAPSLVYVLQGRGTFGHLVPGCPETYESESGSEREGGGEQERERYGEMGRRFRDRHQKVGQLRKGDIVASPAGIARWVYNDGDEELVLVALEETSNRANQLDENPRSFYLAGNPRSGGEGGQQRQRESAFRHHGQGGRGQPEFGNVFRGFDAQWLSEIFQVDEETARKLQGEDENRGHIITVERSLQVLSPPHRGEEERYRRGERRQYGGRGGSSWGNGLEETVCSARVKENIDRPSRADVYNPEAGRYSTVNCFTLPILRFLGLSAGKGVLHENAIMAPHWYTNAHSIVYFTRGEGRAQVVNHRGEAVFDGDVNEGQVLVVPHNFAVVKRAAGRRLEWVEFNTNHDAMINTLAGRTSALRGLPADVVAAAYQIPREEAQRLKSSRRETFLFQSDAGERSRRIAAA
ncbi:hypothetical protein M569_12535, partial [Genlisea aurea]